MLEKAILRNREVVPVNDLVLWALWFEESFPDRVVKQTQILEDCEVSTVFLGINHQFEEGQPPLWFETLVMGGDNDGQMCRWSTYDEAEKGHAYVCERIRKGLQ